MSPLYHIYCFLPQREGRLTAYSANVVPNLGWGWEGGGGLTSGRFLLGRVQACRRPRPPLEEPQGASCGLPGIPVFPDIFLRVQLGAVVTLSRGWSDVTSSIPSLYIKICTITMCIYNQCISLFILLQKIFKAPANSFSSWWIVSVLNNYFYLFVGLFSTSSNLIFLLSYP